MDEDDFWWNGIVYYNKNDSSTIVNARIGFGSTINLARPAGQIIMGLTVFLLLSMVPFCAWLIKEEFTDVRVEMTDDSIQAYHLSLEYEVPLEEITNCTLLDELPNASRNFGTGMQRVCKGNYSVKGIDKNARVCLNPESELFLVLSTTDKTYIFSMGDESEEASRQLHDIYLALRDYLSVKTSETHP